MLAGNFNFGFGSWCTALMASETQEFETHNSVYRNYSYRKRRCAVELIPGLLMLRQNQIIYIRIRQSVPAELIFFFCYASQKRSDPVLSGVQCSIPSIPDQDDRCTRLNLSQTDNLIIVDSIPFLHEKLFAEVVILYTE